MTFDELVNDLADCVEAGLYFEVDAHGGRILLEGIRDLLSAAEDDRGVL